MPRRYSQSSQHVKTNFTLGHNGNLYSSTYDKDFNPHAIRDTRLLNFYNEYKLAHKLPKVFYEDSDFNIKRSKKNPKVQKTYVTFGNDNDFKPVTAYEDFTKTLCYKPKEKAVPHPVEAEILPPSYQPPPMRSSLKNDFTFFGANMNQNVYGGRLDELKHIKDINTHDSVAVNLLGRRRKMLTRSMIDYKHPLERIKGNIKDFMVQQISPSVRQDSVWQSVTTDNKEKISSENKGNFSWPHAEKGMKRFYMGKMNKVR